MPLARTCFVVVLSDSVKSVYMQEIFFKLYLFTQRRPCPEEDATFLSRITWWWQNKQMWAGWRRPLMYDDLADLCYKDKSEVVASRFISYWDKELKKTG